MFGHLSFSLRATPVIVPPVPAPATSMSTLPGWKEQKKKKKEAILKSRLKTAANIFLLQVVRTVALLQDLLGRGVVVSQGVAWVAVLVQDVRVGDLVLEAPSHTHVGLGRIETSAGGCTDNLSAESSQDVHLQREARHKQRIVIITF